MNIHKTLLALGAALVLGSFALPWLAEAPALPGYQVAQVLLRQVTVSFRGYTVGMAMAAQACMALLMLAAAATRLEARRAVSVSIFGGMACALGLVYMGVTLSQDVPDWSCAQLSSGFWTASAGAIVMLASGVAAGVKR